MKKNYTIIIALLLCSTLNAKDKVLSVSPPPNAPPIIVATAGQSTELHYCPESPITNIEFVVSDRETLFKDLVARAVYHSKNPAAAIQVLNLKNRIPPIVSAKPISVQLNYAGIVIITPPVVNNDSTDGHEIISYAINNPSFDCASDVIAPTVITRNYVVELNTGGTVSIDASNINNGSTDNCGIKTVTISKSNFDCSNVGNNVVKLTVTDNSGNISTANAIVTILDNIAPIVTTKSYTAQLNALGTVTIVPANVNNGSTDNCSIASLTLSKSTFTCANIGSNVISLTATDNSGNTSTEMAIVTVKDEIAPVLTAPANRNVTTTAGQCGWSPSEFGQFLSVTATDNCAVGVPIGKRSDNLALTALYPIGTTTITWTVTDANGNAALPIIQTVDVSDDDKPTITTTPIIVDTNSACIWNGTLGLPVTADNCSVASVTSDKPADFAYPVGGTTVTWTVKDLAGNTETATQTVTVRDTEKPIAKASDITIKLSSTVGAGAATITVVQVNNGSSDNCGIKTVGGLVLSKTSFDCSNVGPNTVVLTVTDNSDNVSTANAIVTVIDDVLPVINSVSPITVNNSPGICGANLAVTPSAIVTDNCSVPNPVVGTRSDAKALNAVYPIGRTIITWNVKDANGNAALPVIQTVDVTDNEKPLITSNGTKTVNTDLGGCSAIVLVSATATDNCSVGSPTGVRSDNLPLAALYPIGTTTITWNVTDANGNAAVAVPQTVTVKDEILPIARTRNITVQLNAAGTVSIAASDINNSSTDNCNIASYTLSKSNFDCSNVGPNTITLTATDASGNNSIPVNATVTVQDNINPVVITKTYTAQLNASGTVTIVPADINNGSTDNCSITTLTLSKDTFTCANVGPNTVALTAKDASGNTSIAFATVTVQDVTAPVVDAKDISLVLKNGSVTIKAEDVLVSATDACGVDTYELSQYTFTIVDVLKGKVPVTLSVTDVNGNIGTDVFEITFPTPIIATQAITPNGDRNNDTWVVVNITNHPNSVVRVFNRWGSLVYSAKNYQNDWDGKLNGSDVTVPDGGSYYYQIDLKGTGNVDSEGWLYISRQ